ncbi:MULTISPECIES: S-layer homology domain-containing protein [Solibacillus]|uniref:S-layer homology domain-containing protein n=1 Tax=Solibacillus merdavium TaxID=2762218 RepID=A0ABR8XQ11_9BACL|nr:S-layer homology domain-containing protein [Solibacillus merdavium]MBD8034028.1 S-layer homology domain-containing protein [Solibacillus merdavium]
MTNKKSAALFSILSIPAAIVITDAPAYANSSNSYDWQVYNVESLIDQINSASSTYDYYLKEARNAYNALTYYQQTQVRNAATLFYYLDTYENHQDILNIFVGKMNAISARNSTFIRDIEDANRYYNSLTYSQKNAIPNHLYIQLQNYVENLKKMEAVQLSFEQLNTKDWNYLSNYQSAMQAYNLLPYDFRTLLSPIANEKMREYEQQQSPAYNRSIAQKVMTAISKLNTSSTQQQVEAVRKEYNALNTVQQRLVTNLEDLLYIEEAQRNIAFGWDPYYYEDNRQKEDPTSIEVSKKENSYSVLIPVSDMKWNTPTKITVSDSISLSIPRSAIPASYNNGVVAVSIDEVKGGSILFSASMDNENLQFSSYIDIEVKNIPASATILRLGNDGEFEATPYTRVANKHVLKTKNSAEYIVSEHNPKFFDIQGDGHRYQIEQLAKRKIVSGVENNYFKPSAHVTLAQYAAMISRSMGLKANEDSTYQDVHGKWFEASIQSLLEVGILDNKNSNYFNAEQVVTRKQAALLSIRMLQHAGVTISDPNLSKIPFTDLKQLSSSERYYIALAYEYGIFGGKENGQFDPNGKLTRSQMAKVLHRTLQIAKMI